MIVAGCEVYSVSCDTHYVHKACQFVYEHGDEVCPAKWQPGVETLKPSLLLHIFLNFGVDVSMHLGKMADISGVVGKNSVYCVRVALMRLNDCFIR